MWGLIFSGISLAGLGLMGGAVLYTSLVEIPVRQKTEPVEQLRNWQLVFPAASGLLKPFGVALSSAILLSGLLTDHWLWYAAFVAVMALVPVTAVWIAATNSILLNMEEDEDPHKITSTIKGWDRLHHLRTVMTLAAFLIALAAAFIPLF